MDTGPAMVDKQTIESLIYRPLLELHAEHSDEINRLEKWMAVGRNV